MLNLTRTTVRIPPQLKKTIELMAIEQDVTFQDIFQDALREYVDKKIKKKAKKKIVFYSQDMGVALDNLTREDIYAD